MSVKLYLTSCINNIIFILASKTLPTEPPSYANLLKSETSGGMTFASAMSNSAANSGNVRSNVNPSAYTSRAPQDARPETNQSQPAPQRAMNSRPPTRGMFCRIFVFVSIEQILIAFRI